jgi:excisionase family DNA binding protein
LWYIDGKAFDLAAPAAGLPDKTGKKCRTIPASSGPIGHVFNSNARGFPMYQPLEPFAATIRESCRLTGLSRTTIYNLIAAGRLAPIKVGKRTLISVEELRKLVSPERVLTTTSADARNPKLGALDLDELLGSAA